MASIAWNETRARGPVLSVAAWLAHAAAAFPRATLVGKVDDDAYIHTVELEALLRGVVSQLAPQIDRLYLGSMSWFHWFPKIFERSGFGWTFSNAWGYGDGCRNATAAAIRCGSHRRIGSSDDCGACSGPFPFMSGYLMLFSTALAAELAASEAMRSDVERLKAMPKFMSRGGGPSNKVMEDIWLGSLLHRAPPARPLTYVALEEYLTGVFVSDGWGLKVRDGTPPSRTTTLTPSQPRQVAPTALLVHIKGKQIERFLATHEFLADARAAEEAALRTEVGADVRGGLRRVLGALGIQTEDVPER